ncbi:hypothetical protein N9N67_10455 [Bacteriovoracaceae bacterium]|nr:hypothetical protein [Bacteriovoracaceae bacterium]
MKKIIGEIFPFEWNRHGEILKYSLHDINGEEFLIESSRVKVNFERLINQKMMVLAKFSNKNHGSIAIHSLKRFH